MKSVLITGGTGMVGTQLCRKLSERGHEVSVLSRSKTNSPYRTFLWNIEDGTIEEGAVESADHIIHLAGANLGDKRWTAKRKQEIIDSRVKSADLILQRLRETNHSLKTFISASAVGYYGAKTSEKIFTEADPPADDFLGTTCRLWEEVADRFRETGARVVKIRSGVVLSKNDGALKRMMLPVSLGIGSALGSGRQYLPWIHVEDLCNVFINALEGELMNGAYNAVAPDHRTNEEFLRTLAGVMHRPFRFPRVPAFMLKLMLGEMSEMVLYGSRVSPERLIDSGFRFAFPGLEKVLADVVGYEF